MAGPIPYRLDCTGDRSWSGTADAQQTAPGTFIAVGVLPFDVKHEEQISCVLKTDLQSPPKIVALRGRHYPCIKRNVDPAPGGLVSDPRPPTVQPDGPRVVVDPPRPVCVGGRIVTTGSRPTRHSCRCPAGQIAEATGPHTYRCLGKTPASILCAGGTVRSGQCICPSTTTKVAAGANAWRCMRKAETSPSRFKMPPPRVSGSRAPERLSQTPGRRPEVNTATR